MGVSSSSTAKRVRSLPFADLDQACRDGEEFAMVMVRRVPGDSVKIIGEVTSDPNLMRKAAKALPPAQERSFPQSGSDRPNCFARTFRPADHSAGSATMRRLFSDQLA